jgi:hypothetical protein
MQRRHVVEVSAVDSVLRSGCCLRLAGWMVWCDEPAGYTGSVPSQTIPSARLTLPRSGQSGCKTRCGVPDCIGRNGNVYPGWSGECASIGCSVGAVLKSPTGLHSLD